MNILRITVVVTIACSCLLIGNRSSLFAEPPIVNPDPNACVGCCAQKHPNNLDKCYACCNERFPNAGQQAEFLLCLDRCDLIVR
jgi:hypothetical protein